MRHDTSRAAGRPSPSRSMRPTSKSPTAAETRDFFSSLLVRDRTRATREREGPWMPFKNRTATRQRRRGREENRRGRVGSERPSKTPPPEALQHRIPWQAVAGQSGGELRPDETVEPALAVEVGKW